MLKGLIDVFRMLYGGFRDTPTSLPASDSGVKPQEALRVKMDAHLAEYEAVRREIELRANLQYQVINYFFFIIAGVITATQVFGSVTSVTLLFFQKHPEAFLALALIMLYFPHLMVKNNYYMAVLGSYTRNVLSSKIEALSKFDVLGNESKYLIWESEKFPDWLTGEIKWDAYRSKAMFSGPIIGVSAILSFFDNFVVFAPSLTLFVLYFFERGERELSWLGVILIAIYISVCFALVTLMSLGKQAYVGVAPPVINRTVFERKDKPQN